MESRPMDQETLTRIADALERMAPAPVAAPDLMRRRRLFGTPSRIGLCR